ncbi:hypothetical protein D1AOALGA4SA_3121 [Olavius algarvensis Delta 1 endosymbiont]|nr:hypothetical protein D1AOALGA4SA_3121 [Olavius algarvensis Delta 1 endosymbiont]
MFFGKVDAICTNARCHDNKTSVVKKFSVRKEKEKFLKPEPEHF